MKTRDRVAMTVLRKLACNTSSKQFMESDVVCAFQYADIFMQVRKRNDPAVRTDAEEETLEYSPFDVRG